MLALEANLPRLEARRTRRALQYRPDVKLTADQVRELVLAETGSEAAAEDAWKRFRHAELRAGLTPE